ncbi:MAG: CTP synthetase [Nanohaloarchaea archaeon SW_10_44_10]|nr:MAG: CTP synthetase [Nanohaloarchaea archaeon SW_10_44_10]
MPKWIFVTGGVLSGLGKGLVSASISKLLQLRKQEVVPIKCDGYLNVDPGTMNPHEHGEVFVLDDGTEVDMDFGHYERFLGIETKGDWNLTSGKIFQNVIERERKGEYLGKTVQMVPHVTDEIKNSWKESAEEEDTDIVIIEIGGTVGDMENQFYLEAARQMRSELPEEDTYLIHTTLVPYLETTGEQKTKPTQHSVRDLREVGLEPDMIVGRSKDLLEESVQEKIALFCDVDQREVVSDPNVDTVYRLPILFDEQNADKMISEKLELPDRTSGLGEWKARVGNLASESIASVAIFGKYTAMNDSYVSIEEALKHASAELGGSVKIDYRDTENLQLENIDDYDGIIIPGGFGSRGVEGKMEVIRYCRENGIPILGLCYGMQLMVIEYLRSCRGMDAVSEEFENGEEHKVIAELPGQKDIEEMGGTMRLGAYEAEVEGKVKKIYGSERAVERHRHRYEVNPEYHDKLQNGGIKISGFSTENRDLAEYLEKRDHPFFIGTQAHPEFTSSFEEPNPLYLEFVEQISK